MLLIYRLKCIIGMYVEEKIVYIWLGATPGLGIH